MLFFDIHIVCIVSSVSARKLKCPARLDSARNLHSSGSLEPENSSSNSSLIYGYISIHVIYKEIFLHKGTYRICNLNGSIVFYTRQFILSGIWFSTRLHTIGMRRIQPRTTDTQTELFFKNSKLLGLGRQIGPKFYKAFGVFLAKLLALFWHCESLVHGKI